MVLTAFWLRGTLTHIHLPHSTQIPFACTHSLSDEAIAESYGVAVVFHEEEEGGGGKGETTVAQDEEEEEGGDEEEGVEADYEGVLHADVSKVATAIHFCSPYIKSETIKGFPRLLGTV